MIEVTIDRDERDKIVYFLTKGHAYYAPHGQDIICAAISAIVQTTLLGLTEVVGLDPHYTVDSGRVECYPYTPLEKEAGASVLLETFFHGITTIANEYPDYVRVVERRRMIEVS